MTKRVLIRADGNKDVGMGHIVRACLVANMLKDRFQYTVTVVAKENEAVRSFVSQRKVGGVFIQDDLDTQKEAMELIRIINEEKIDLIILDVLENDVNQDYMSKIKETQAQCVVITDDSHRRVIDADLIWNANPNQKTEYYTKEAARYILGPENFIMDETYAGREAAQPAKEIKSILVTLGGSDHNNLMFKVLDSLNKINGPFKVRIITTKASGYIEELTEYLKGLTVNTELLTDVPSLIDHWGKSDLAVTAGGNTLFERIAIRMPGATICQLKRQMEIADCFEKLGVNVNIGFGPDISEKDLTKKIRRFINDHDEHTKQYIKAPQIIKGDGLIRFGQEIQKVLEEGKNGLRTVKTA